MARPQKDKGGTAANIGYEAQLWQMADALRGSMDAAEYKHVVLGLLFLKYISDAFEEKHAQLEAERAQGADPEDQDEYRAENIFWVPIEARWSHLKAQAKQPTIGQHVDDAMTGIERDNPALKGRCREPRQGRSWSCVRILPVAVRQCRGKEGGRILHPPLRCPYTCRNDRAIQRPRV